MDSREGSIGYVECKVRIKKVWGGSQGLSILTACGNSEPGLGDGGGTDRGNGGVCEETTTFSDRSRRTQKAGTRAPWEINAERTVGKAMLLRNGY